MREVGKSNAENQTSLFTQAVKFIAVEAVVVFFIDYISTYFFFLIVYLLDSYVYNTLRSQLSFKLYCFYTI